tara:strand:+ start:339 stop:650 length:312 start_codon:yes stop_codon:yes gene_type:complete
MKDFNFKKKLTKEKKIDNKFCQQLHNLTLEELIALKLQLATSTVKGKLYGFPILKFTNNIVKESVINFAISVTDSYREAAKVLGISHIEIYNYAKNNNLLTKD